MFNKHLVEFVKMGNFRIRFIPKDSLLEDTLHDLICPNIILEQLCCNFTSKSNADKINLRFLEIDDFAVTKILGTWYKKNINNVFHKADLYYWTIKDDNKTIQFCSLYKNVSPCLDVSKNILNRHNTGYDSNLEVDVPFSYEDHDFLSRDIFETCQRFNEIINGNYK